MRISTLITALCLTFAGVQLAQADIVSTYNVETDFDDGTSFYGSLKFDATTSTVVSLSGTLDDSMGDTLTFNGTSGPLTQSSDGNGGILASIYLNAPTFSYPNASTVLSQTSINNAFETIAFSAADPTNTANYVNDIVTADCTAGSTMSNCSTGIYGGGTMGNPQAETITFVSSSGTGPAAVPLPSAVWTFLAGTLGLLSWGKKRKTA